MKPPRSLEDLPFAAELERCSGEDLADAGDYDRAWFDGGPGGGTVEDAAAGGARFIEVAFVDLRGATLGGADSSGAEAPGIRSGYDCLRGCRVGSPQLMTLAPLMAHHLGIRVD